MRLMMATALAVMVAGCAGPEAPDYISEAAAIRREALDRDSSQVRRTLEAALNRAREICFGLHPAPARPTPQQVAQRTALVLDCYEQRSDAAVARANEALSRLEVEHVGALRRDVEAAERARAPTPPGSYLNPIWIRPTR